MIKNIWTTLKWKIRYHRLWNELKVLDIQLEIILLRLKIKDMSDGTPET